MTNTTTSTTVGGLIHEAGRSPRHSLGSNNSSNLSSPPSPHIRDGNPAGNNQLHTHICQETSFVLKKVQKHILLKIKNKFCATTNAEYQPAIIFSRQQMLILLISLLLRISRFEYKTLFVIKVFLIVIFIILCTVAFIRTTH